MDGEICDSDDEGTEPGRHVYSAKDAEIVCIVLKRIAEAATFLVESGKIVEPERVLGLFLKVYKFQVSDASCVYIVALMPASPYCRSR